METCDGPPPPAGGRSIPIRPTASLLARARVRVTGPLTQRQVAALLGLRQQTVNAVEQRALAKLRRALARGLPP